MKLRVIQFWQLQCDFTQFIFMTNASAPARTLATGNFNANKHNPFLHQMTMKLRGLWQLATLMRTNTIRSCTR